MQRLKISKGVVLYLQVILLDLILGAMVALAIIVRFPEVVLFEGLLDVVFSANCFFAFLTFNSLFLLNLYPDLIGREAFEPLFL